MFIRGRKLNISIIFITQSYFKLPKDVRLNSTHFFIIKIPNKTELQEIALKHSWDIDFKVFLKTYIKFTYSILGKAFEKQIKTIEYQGKNQKIKTIKKYAFSDNDSPLISKQKNI